MTSDSSHQVPAAFPSMHLPPQVTCTRSSEDANRQAGNAPLPSHILSCIPTFFSLLYETVLTCSVPKFRGGLVPCSLTYPKNPRFHHWRVSGPSVALGARAQTVVQYRSFWTNSHSIKHASITVSVITRQRGGYPRWASERVQK